MTQEIAIITLLLQLTHNREGKHTALLINDLYNIGFNIQLIDKGIKQGERVFKDKLRIQGFNCNMFYELDEEDKEILYYIKMD